MVLFLDFTPKGLIPFRESMLYISTFPFLHKCDVGRHNDHRLGDTILTGDLHGLVHSPPISGWVSALIPYVTACSKWYDIVPFGPNPHGFVLGVYPKRPHTI
jgi:hypothetical protein